MTKQEILGLIKQIEYKIMVGYRNNGKLLLYNIIADAKLKVLEELRIKIINYNNKEKHK